MDFKKYIGELKRRNVIKSAVAYAIVSWLIIQIASIVLPTFKAPEYLMKFIFFILIVGFPINLIFAWIYDITPEGIQKTKNLEQKPPKSKLKSAKLNKVIIGSLVFVVVILLFKINWSSLTDESNALVSSELKSSVHVEDSSIAVIPFANESSDEQNQYFVNGMTEDIRNNLSKISNLIVRSKTSSEKYRVTSLTSKEIGEELSINYLLEGTVQKVGNQVKIHAQLISTTNDAHLWQETYVRDISNVEEIFKVQSAIAQSIAEELKIVVTPKEKIQLASIPTKSVEAYDNFLQGNEIFDNAWSDNFNLKKIKESLTFYEKAIALDENFSSAYTGIGRIYWWLASYDKFSLRKENYKKSKYYLKEAMRLDPSNGWAYSEMAVINSNWDWNRKEARRNLEKAIKLNPNGRNGYIDFFHFEFTLGNCGKMIGLKKELARLDPKYSLPQHSYSLMLLHCQKRYVAIISILDDYMLETDKIPLKNKVRIAFSAYLHENNFDRANEIINYEKDSIKLLDSYLSLKGMLAAKRGDRKGALKFLSGMREEAKEEHIPQISFAAVYALLEEKENMYLHLEKGVRDHEPDIHEINFYSAFDSYKHEFRFQEVIRKMWIPYKE